MVAAGFPIAAAARPIWVPRRLYPFEPHYTWIDGSLVHYVDEGDGRPILLLHGVPVWSFVYRSLIRALGQGVVHRSGSPRLRALVAVR